MVSDQPRSGRALVVVTDGLGYSPERVHSLAAEIFNSLSTPAKQELIDAASTEEFDGFDRLALARRAVMPITAEGLPTSSTIRDAQEVVAKVNRIRAMLSDGVTEEIDASRRNISRENRYVPWIGGDAEWSNVVNHHLTVPTRASGVWVGYEDVTPEVQGNSETGHQQIGNLALAPQIPLAISQSIEDASFFSNDALVSTIEEALGRGGSINFRFLLSGLRGSDGRVHSAWNHQEAFCALLFERLSVPPNRVRMQAILDGRDAPAQGSLVLEDDDLGYIDHLEQLLAKHDALECLAWVIGRSIGMDRDFREENARDDYLLLTEGKGEPVSDFDGLRAFVKSIHDAGMTDADVPPIAMSMNRGETARIESGDGFVNLNFRSDRQRASTASLCGAREYLQREANARGRTWGFDWMRDDLDLSLCTIAEYDAEFEQAHGVKVAFPITPHRLNFLSNWDRLMPTGSRYLLVAESVKALHMGYFVRGRREADVASTAEDRTIVPSHGRADGVNSDSDFYLNPGMRTDEIVEHVAAAMSAGDHRMIICNLAAPDMIGHLLPTRFEAAIDAYRLTVKALARLAKSAEENGYSMIVTSDHGNIENDSPTHTVNPVLTTVIPPSDRAQPSDEDSSYSAKLFDLMATAARLIDADESEVAKLIDEHRGETEDEYVGRSLIR